MKYMPEIIHNFCIVSVLCCGYNGTSYRGASVISTSWSCFGGNHQWTLYDLVFEKDERDFFFLDENERIKC